MYTLIIVSIILLAFPVIWKQRQHYAINDIVVFRFRQICLTIFVIVCLGHRSGWEVHYFIAVSCLFHFFLFGRLQFSDFENLVLTRFPRPNVSSLSDLIRSSKFFTPLGSILVIYLISWCLYFSAHLLRLLTCLSNSQGLHFSKSFNLWSTIMSCDALSLPSFA